MHYGGIPNSDCSVSTEWSKVFDSVTGDTEPRNLFSREFCSRYLVEKALLLDIGCGNGTFLHLLNRRNNIGLELDETAIQIAKRNCPDNDFIQASSLCLPFKDGMFNNVTLWEVIEHVPPGEESTLIAEVSRVLKKDANLTMSTPNANLFSIMLDPAYFLRGHRHYRVSDLTTILSRNKFQVKESLIQGGLFMLITTNIFYFFKHVLRRRPDGRIYSWFARKAKREYGDHYTGIANVFLASTKK